MYLDVKCGSKSILFLWDVQCELFVLWITVTEEDQHKHMKAEVGRWLSAALIKLADNINLSPDNKNKKKQKNLFWHIATNTVLHFKQCNYAPVICLQIIIHFVDIKRFTSTVNPKSTQNKCISKNSKVIRFDVSLLNTLIACKEWLMCNWSICTINILPFEKCSFGLRYLQYTQMECIVCCWN